MLDVVFSEPVRREAAKRPASFCQKINEKKTACCCHVQGNKATGRLRRDALAVPSRVLTLRRGRSAGAGKRRHHAVLTVYSLFYSKRCQCFLPRTRCIVAIIVSKALKKAPLRKKHLAKKREPQKDDVHRGMHVPHTPTSQISTWSSAFGDEYMNMPEFLFNSGDDRITKERMDLFVLRYDILC